MTTRPWYIWFSALAFMILWGDTSLKVKYHRDTRVHWPGALWNGVRLWGLHIMILPLVSLHLILLVLTTIDNVLSSHITESIPRDVWPYILLLLIYINGVYITIKHIEWRHKNIPHLL